MQFTKGNFITLRATTKIHLGAIGEDVLEDDIVEFDGQTLKMGGNSHQLSALKGAMLAWLDPSVVSSTWEIAC